MKELLKPLGCFDRIFCFHKPIADPCGKIENATGSRLAEADQLLESIPYITDGGLCDIECGGNTGHNAPDFIHTFGVFSPGLEAGRSLLNPLGEIQKCLTGCRRKDFLKFFPDHVDHVLDAIG